MSRSRNLLMAGTQTKLPSAEEVALRPELVKQMLHTVAGLVDQHDLEHAVIIGIASNGAPRAYHSYGVDLPVKDLVQLLRDIIATTEDA